MRNTFTFMLLAAVIFLASCGSGGVKITNLIAIPAGDSVSKGSNFKITFNNSGSDSEYFNINDLTVNNSPIYALSVNAVMNPNDSFWTAKIVVTDYLTKQIAFNLTVYRDSTTPYGIYWTADNSSTLTDYSLGQNRVYQIATGSEVTFTGVNTIFESGTFSLNLYYNYKINQATGSFKIYN